MSNLLTEGSRCSCCCHYSREAGNDGTAAATITRWRRVTAMLLLPLPERGGWQWYCCCCCQNHWFEFLCRVFAFRFRDLRRAACNCSVISGAVILAVMFSGNGGI